MKYKDIRSEIKTGDLLAWSSGSWKTWAGIQINIVRIFTRSEYSHVGLAYVNHGRVFILEAVGAGVRIFPLSKELPFYYISKPTKLSRAATTFAFEQLGEKYSKFQAILGGLGLLKDSQDDKWQCAEYVYNILKTDQKDMLDTELTPSAIVKKAASTWGPIFYVEA